MLIQFYMVQKPTAVPDSETLRKGSENKVNKLAEVSNVQATTPSEQVKKVKSTKQAGSKHQEAKLNGTKTSGLRGLTG